MQKKKTAEVQNPNDNHKKNKKLGSKKIAAVPGSETILEEIQTVTDFKKSENVGNDEFGEWQSRNNCCSSYERWVWNDGTDSEWTR
jgi:hypothetical protein